jgi:aminopeptidase N
MTLNESLGVDYDERLKKGMRVQSATLADGAPVGIVQDPWEGGFSLVLPHVLDVGQKITVKLRMEAEHAFMTWTDFHYPLSTETWFPRHGELQRSRFHVIFLHKAKTKVISIGNRVREEAAPDGNGMLTEWVTQDAVALDAFAVGPFERHADLVKVGERKVPIEFYSLPSGYAPIKEDFVVAELMNGVNYFSQLFGAYPYDRLGAVFFPSNFGQGFPTMLLLPVQGRSGLHDFSFIAHEISHQWWGDQVLWRSYRDQWLSEGFAEYSAALYASRRDNPKRALDLVRDMRRELQEPPRNDTGIGAGKVYEIGPLIMGQRLSSRRSGGAYFSLVYGKGALTLRMLHFLFTNPVDGDDAAFYKMMKKFVEENRNGSASTENFFALASQQFAQTPIAKKYGMTDLIWFLQQWVYGTGMPTYRLEYHLEPRPEGGVLLLGTLFQEGVPDDWIMPIPLFMDYGGGKGSRGTILARGPKTEIKIGLPAEPKQATLDPDLWVLSNNSSQSRTKH